MPKKWIEENGTGSTEELKTYLIDKNESLKGYTFIAMYTDSFVSGKYEGDMNLEFLLEARIFCESTELYISRSSIGEDFAWRSASEKNCDNSDYYEQYQIIDINSEKSYKDEAHGKMNIISTVGGRYELPINDGQTRIRIISYVDYDENGMAFVADNRVCGFVE